jgi:tRNA threonylcarbamoyladenosine biosynthesis protein TsaB
MVILGFDSAMNGCSVALWRDGACTSKSEAMPSGQAERLVPMIQEVLAAARAAFSDIDLIVTTVGPGAFTGIRIALSTARALGLALNVPVKGITTTDVLAAAFFEKETLRENETLCVLIDTKRSDFYMQRYDAQEKPCGDPISAAADDILNTLPPRTILIGDAVERFLSLVDSKDFQTRGGYTLPDPSILCRLAAVRDIESLLPPEPLYLRGADVSQSKKIHRKIAETT